MAGSKQTLQFSETEIEEIRVQFDQFDADQNGHITASEIGSVMKALGESVPGYKIRDMIREVDIDENGTVEFNEFLVMYNKVKSGKTTFALNQTAEKAKKLVLYQGGTTEASSEGTTHSFSQEETTAFSNWITRSLSSDPDCTKYLPVIPEGNDLFDKCKDGIVLCKLINTAQAETIDERAINKGKLNVFTKQENLTLALNSASSIGCNIVNIGATDLQEGRPHLVLGLIWQIIKIGLFSEINLNMHPNLAALLRDGEDIKDLMALSPEEILLRWFNYHLEQAGHPRRVNNFSGDIKDSECYTVLLNQIAPKDAGVDMSPMGVDDVEERAEKMLQQAQKIGCRSFVAPKDVVKGNQRLNLAFVANLFNNHPALETPPDIDLSELQSETREEKTYRNWMNSLGVNPFVNSLYQDTRDGLILLQLFDKVKPGIVNWDKVNQSPSFKKMGGNMKKLENCNYCVELGMQMRFSLVGIAGKDINDGNETLTLALVWQLMKAYTLSLLAQLAGSDKPIKDQEIIDWVNKTLSEKGKSSHISTFKDPRISNSAAVLDLIDALKPGAIDYSLVRQGKSEEDLLANAKYAISMSRKIGARVYALPEDIVEVTNKMVMTIFACLMTYAKSHAS